MSEDDARARIAAQADDDQRRAVADIWLDNSGTPEALAERARGVWNDRILPFAHNLSAGRPVNPSPESVPADPTWPDQARRVVARLKATCGAKALRVDHIGATAVPGIMDAEDVIDIQVTVESLAVADELAEPLLAAGYPRIDDITADTPLTDDPRLWDKRIHGSADPGRPTRVHLRVDGWPNQQFGLLLVDWLTAVGGESVDRDDIYRRAWEWADATGWQP